MNTEMEVFILKNWFVLSFMMFGMAVPMIQYQYGIVASAAEFPPHIVAAKPYPPNFKSDGLATVTVKFTTENGQAIKGNYIIQNEQLYQPLDLSNDSEIVIPGYELTSISKRRLKTTIHKSDHQVILKYTPVAVEQPTPQETKTSNEVGNPNKENSAAGSQQTVVKSTEATGTQSANHSNNNQSPDLKLGQIDQAVDKHETPGNNHPKNESNGKNLSAKTGAVNKTVEGHLPIEQPFGNKGSVLTSTDQSKSQPKSSDLSQLPNGVIGKQPADILNETVYLSGVDNHGNQLFSRSTTVSTTELPNLLANNVDYYGYKWQRSTYDDKRHMITHHYVPERASFKVIHLDNAGHQISSKQINAEFGSMVTIAPRTIKGYHCLDKSRTIKLVSMFPEDVQFHYRRDNFEDKSSRVSQAKAQPKQSEAIRSKHVSDSKLASHSRLADKQDSRKHLPQTGDTTFKAGPLIGILMLLGLISLKVIKHRP